MRASRGDGGSCVVARAFALVLTLAAAGCLPRARINAECRWARDAALPPSGDPARRTHLVQDVRVAEDLGIRYADASAGRMNTPAWHRAQTWCTARSLAAIEQLHHVSDIELAALRGARDVWFDLLVVGLPVAVMFAAASRAIAARVVDGYEREDRVAAAGVLVVVAPVAAGLGVGLAQIWGGIVEQWRLRSDHISYRAFELPESRHGWSLWTIALLLFSGICVMELLRRRESPARRNRAAR